MVKLKTGLITGAVAGLCMAFAAQGAETLPPCQPDKPIPKGGCMAPKDPVTPLDKLQPAPPLKAPAPGEIKPAPPLTVPPGTVVPAPPSGALAPPSADAPAVVKPPPTGDGEIVKPAPPTDPKMPVVKPPANVEPRAN